MTYTYNLSGALIEETYPSGSIVKNVLDNEGDLSMVQSKKNAASGYFNYAKNFTYTAAGAVSSMQLGNGKWETTQFSSSRQITQIGLGHSATDTSLWKANYEYGEWNGTAIDPLKNNGNLARQTILVPTVGAATGFTAVQTYTYDKLDRLKSAAETVGGSQTWKQSFLYDRFGNKNFDTPNTTTLGSCAAAVCNPTANPANNRLNSYGYDNAGNVTTDAEPRTFTYDGENRQITATGNNLSATYSYDGNGERVKSHNSLTNQTTIFVYDAEGDLTAEYTINIPPPTNPTISYLTEDALGSVRVTTNSFGEIKARRDFLPFGEELYAGLAGRNTNQKYSSNTDDTRKKFATYQRDIETGLDFAQSRYYSSILGRFTSPDEFKGGPDELFDFEADASDNPTFYADLSNPQSLNKYQYGYNNPYKFNDPIGHCPLCWVAAEIAGTVADVVATVRTFRDPNASTAEKVVTVVGTIAGAALPGGGYAVGGKALVKAFRREATETVVKKADDVVDTVKTTKSVTVTKQTRLKKLGKDGKESKSNKGWIKQEKNQIDRGKRKNIRVPPGKQLAHQRGREAAKGYDHKNSKLQDTKLHKTQHKYDGKGRKNKERPLD